jgi:hypothetical protein
MSLQLLGAAVWFVLILLVWIARPSDLVWLGISAVWAVVFFGCFMWLLAKEAEAAS